MDKGQIIFMTSRLVLGAAAAFFAIMLWSKTRDAAWMLMVIGALAAYVEIVYSILDMSGITGGLAVFAGSVPLAAIMLSALRTGFCIAAFLVMVVRRYRYR
jgi:hypothetical protein